MRTSDQTHYTPGMARGSSLLDLFNDVAARSRVLAAAHPEWPCRAGCDTCCRRLARVPELHRSEWRLLRAALLDLPENARAQCLAAAETLRREVAVHGETRPVACPLLDSERGVCRVYEARPLACRSYGFARSRGHDAWCEQVAGHVAGLDAELPFINEDALKRQLEREDPERRDLLAWLALDGA